MAKVKMQKLAIGMCRIKRFYRSQGLIRCFTEVKRRNLEGDEPWSKTTDQTLASVEPIKSAGFTFIELLVTLVIISIILRMAMFTYGDFGTKRHILQIAKSFEYELNSLSMQAILEDTPFTIKFHTQGYIIIQGTRIVRTKSLPTNIYIQIKPKNSIIISSDGEISTFTISLGSAKTPNIITLYKQPHTEIIIHNA